MIIKPKDLNVYPLVVKAIGEDEANKQLQIVIEESLWRPKSVLLHPEMHSLVGTFVWSNSPQGFEYWSLVSKVINGKISRQRFNVMVGFLHTTKQYFEERDYERAV